jgi:hypothetical protein
LLKADMMRAADPFVEDLAERLDRLRDEGLYKVERVIASPQSWEVVLEGDTAGFDIGLETSGAPHRDRRR